MSIRCGRFCQVLSPLYVTLFLSSQQLKEQKVAGNRTNEVRAPPTDGY